VRELAGAWYGAVAEHLGWGYDAWFDRAVPDLTRAVVAGHDTDEPTVVLGQARGAAAMAFEDALCDLTCLLDVLPARTRRRIDDMHASAALAVGFASAPPRPGDHPSDAPFEDLPGLAARASGLYTSVGADPRVTHALVVVRATPDTAHVVAWHVQEEFPFVERVTCLPGGAFAVLVHRHPGLVLTLGHLDRRLRGDPLTAGSDVTIALRGLPVSRTRLDRFVGALQEPGAVPETFSLDDPRILAALEDAVRVARSATTPAHAPRWSRVRQATRRVWDGGLSLATAGLAAVTLAAAVAGVLGPKALDVVTLPDPVPAPRPARVPDAPGVGSAPAPDSAERAPTSSSRRAGGVVLVAAVSVPPGDAPAGGSADGRDGDDGHDRRSGRPERLGAPKAPRGAAGEQAGDAPAPPRDEDQGAPGKPGKPGKGAKPGEPAKADTALEKQAEREAKAAERDSKAQRRAEKRATDRR